MLHETLTSKLADSFNKTKGEKTNSLTKILLFINAKNSDECRSNDICENKAKVTPKTEPDILE